MNTHVSKQDWQVQSVNIGIPKVVSGLTKSARKALHMADSVLTWVFCAHLVRQIEPGKVEDLELKNPGQSETSRFWRGVH